LNVVGLRKNGERINNGFVNINQLFVPKTQHKVDFDDIIAPREEKVKVNSRKKSLIIDYSLN